MDALSVLLRLGNGDLVADIAEALSVTAAEVTETGRVTSMTESERTAAAEADRQRRLELIDDFHAGVLSLMDRIEQKTAAIVAEVMP